MWWVISAQHYLVLLHKEKEMAMLVSVMADFDNRDFTTRKGADLSYKQ